MPIANVELSNTFNQFRTTTNDVIQQVNKLSDGTGTLTIDSITANTFTGVSSDLNISANTGTDVVSLVTESLRIVGTNGVSTSIVSSSNTINVNLNTSGVTAGTYGSASQVPQIVIDAQGRITSSSNVSVAGVSAFNYHTGNANFQILTSDGGSLTATIGQHLGTSASVSFQDLTVTGNVTFTGNTTTISANNLIVEDNIIQIGKDNVTDVVDLGFIGHYNNGANVHTGLFRDATDSTWKFFQNYPIEPATNTNIDTSNASFQFANVTAHNITANGTFSGSGASLTSIPNSATTANTSNGASTIVSRNSSGGVGISYFSETVNVVTLSGGNTALDWNSGSVWKITLAANSTVNFTNPPANNISRTIVLYVTNSGASQKALTVTGARYTDGVAPVLSNGAGAVDAMTFTTIDGGLNYYGSFVLANLS